MKTFFQPARPLSIMENLACRFSAVDSKGTPKLTVAHHVILAGGCYGTRNAR